MHLAICSAAPASEYVETIGQACKENGHIATLVTSLDEISYPELIDVCWARYSPAEPFGGSAPPRYWQAAQTLEAFGVPAINPLLSQDVAANKLACALLFGEEALPQPQTFSMLRIEEAVAAIGEQMVCKPLYGARGEGVVLVSSAQEAIAHEQALGRPCLLQEPIDVASCLRVIVTEEKVIACYEKQLEQEEGFVVANVARGARRIEKGDWRAADLAKKMLKIVGGDIGGADILIDRHGRYYALEMNLGFAFDTADSRVPEAFVKLAERMAGLKR